MTPENLKARTKGFAIDLIRWTQSLPQTEVNRILTRQLVRAGTSVGANYRAACLAKSKADMVSKLKVVEEEADEVSYWIELLEANGIDSPEGRRLKAEAEEVFRIVVASIKTLRKDVHG